MHTRAPPARRHLCLALLALALPGRLPAQTSPPAQPAQPVAGLAINLPDGTQRRLGLADLQALPMQSATLKRPDGSTYTVQGASVTALLKVAGLDLSQNLGGGFVARHALVAHAADGYRAVFGLAVADPHFGTPPLLVIWAGEDGQALSAARGPLQLIHTTEARPSRWVRQLTALEVKLP